MNNILFKAWFSSILSLLGALLPTSMLQERHLPSKPAQAIVAQAPRTAVVQKAESLPKRQLAAPVQAPEYRLTMMGTATRAGQAVPNAKLVLWITTPNTHEVYQVQTGADGSYSLSVPLLVRTHDPIDWEIKGLEADIQGTEMSGRRIAMDDHFLVAVNAPVEFVND